MWMDIRKTMKVVYRTLFIQKMVCDTQQVAVLHKGIRDSGYRNVNKQLRPECGHKDSCLMGRVVKVFKDALSKLFTSALSRAHCGPWNVHTLSAEFAVNATGKSKNGYF